MPSKVTIDDVNTFLLEAFADENPTERVIELGDGYAKMLLPFDKETLRPGGVISGPTQMMMADVAMYVAIFTKIGIEPMTVTTNLNINFLRPCKAEDVIAECSLIKIGRKLAIGDVRIGGHSQMAVGKPAAQATVTYAMPDVSS